MARGEPGGRTCIQSLIFVTTMSLCITRFVVVTDHTNIINVKVCECVCVFVTSSRPNGLDNVDKIWFANN